VRSRTERGERGDREDVLTGTEDGGRRPNFEVNGVGLFGIQMNDSGTPVHLR
jgi:hypothetical protein